MTREPPSRRVDSRRAAAAPEGPVHQPGDVMTTKATKATKRSATSATADGHVADQHDVIRVVGARVNNLKDVSVEPLCVNLS